MAKTMKDLVLAMLNATLILVALCLVLLLLLLARADALSERVAHQMTALQPVAETLRQTREDIGALQQDLAALQDPSRQLPDQAVARIETRMTGIETRLVGMKQTLSELRDAPTQWIDHGIAQVADQTVNGLKRLRGCTPSGSTVAVQDG